MKEWTADSGGLKKKPHQQQEPPNPSDSEIWKTQRLLSQNLGGAASSPSRRPARGCQDLGRRGWLGGAHERRPPQSKVKTQKPKGRRPDPGLSELTARPGRESGGDSAGRAPAKPSARVRAGRGYLPATRRPRLLSRLPSPGAAGTSAGLQVVEGNRRGGRRPAARVQARAPRGAAGARGAGRRARYWGLGQRTPRLSPSRLNGLSTRVRRRECSANLVACSAASGRPSRSGKPREGRYGTLKAAATFGARVCGGNAWFRPGIGIGGGGWEALGFCPRRWLCVSPWTSCPSSGFCSCVWGPMNVTPDRKNAPWSIDSFPSAPSSPHRLSSRHLAGTLRWFGCEPVARLQSSIAPC